MGTKLIKIYDIVTQKSGYEGRVKLAQQLGVPRSEAAKIEDTEEIIYKFKKAASELIGESIDKLI